MKKHLSVLALWARNSLRKVWVLLGLTVLAEAALFGFRMVTGPGRTLEELLWGVPVAAAVSAFALFLLLTFCGDERKPVGCTLARLSIPGSAVLVWKGVFGTICFLLFWAVQAAGALGLCTWYAAALGAARSGPQTALLSLYRVPFLHSLLPLAEGAGYVRNLLLASALGMETALTSRRLRLGGKPVLGGILITFTVLSFSQGMGFLSENLWVPAAVIVITVWDLVSALAGKQTEEEDES